MAATYGDFGPGTYGGLGPPVATYGEFGVFVVLPASRGSLLLAESASYLASAEMLVADLIDAETLAVSLSVTETAASMVSGESSPARLVSDEV